MKYLFLKSLTVIVLVISACSKPRSNDIRLCLTKDAKGWFYIFLTQEEKGKNIGECLGFDKNNILLISESWITDSAKISLIKNGVNYNDSAYFLSLGDYQDSHKKTHHYYSFFINDTFSEKYIYSDQFKHQEYNSFTKKINSLLIGYGIK